MANIKEPNPYAGYGAAMASKPGNPMAVEWQNANDKQIAEATKPEALAAYLWSPEKAAALLARMKPAYQTDPLDLTVIAAVSQYVMEALLGRPCAPAKCQGRCSTPGAAPCQRKLWNNAMIDAIRKTKDAYIQTFLLDQLRWCSCKCRLPELKKLYAVAANDGVKQTLDFVIEELAAR